MSKRSHILQAPASGSKDLAERFKSAGNDVRLVRDLVRNNDSASVAAAIVALLSSRSSGAVNDAKRRKKTRTRLSTPNETVLEILLFADRDALDAMQLVCLFLRDFIREREVKELPLRSISRVNTGKCFRPWFDGNWERHWRPIVEKAGGLNTGKRFLPATVSELVPYLRLAWRCESLCIDLQWTDAVSTKHRGAAYRALFGELVMPSMFVDVLTVCVDSRSATEALRQLRAFEAFKSISKLVVKEVGGYHSSGAFKEAFFVHAAKFGVRSIEFDSGPHPAVRIGIWSVLAFGFFEPTTGVDRSIRGVESENSGIYFFAQVVRRAAELDNSRPVDFSFKVANVSSYIDDTGFQKYQRHDGRTWLVDDLENHVNVEIKQTDNFVEVHVFSSA